MSNILIKSNSTAKNVWQILYTLGGIGAAVDSAYVVGSTLLAYFKNTLQNDVAAWVTMLSIVAVYLVIVDWALFKFLPDTLNGILSKTTPTNDYNMNKRIRQFYMGTLVYCLLQTGATVAVTLYLRHDAAHISSVKPDLKDVENVTRASGEDLRRNIEIIDNDIKELKKERSQAKNKAEYSNKELVQLRDNGNGWAAGEINKKVSKAGAKYDAMIQDKENLKNGFIGTASTTLQTTVTSISKVNDFKIQDFQINVGAISNLLMFFGIGGTIVQWYAAFMLALMLSGLGIGKRDNNFLGFETKTIDPQTAAPQMVKNTHPHDRVLQANILNNDYHKNTPTPSVQMPLNTIVSQVTQQNTGQTVTRETLTKWRGDCSTYFTRSKTQKTPEARRNSESHYIRLRGFIESLGIEVVEVGNVLDFPNYTTVRNSLPVANNKGVNNA
jgi:hypothetical protein